MNNLEAPLADPRADSAASSQHSMLGDFGGGLSSHLKAPVVGIAQLVSGTTFDDAVSSKPPVPESKSRMAGEMVGDAIIYMGATALLRRLPNVGTAAPLITGGVLGLIEPLKNGEGMEKRLINGALGVGTMAMIEHGPGVLAATGLISSAEKSAFGAIASGAVIGGATEQVNSLARTGHMATLSQTAIGALSFGLTSGAFHGLGNIAKQRATDFGERSRTADAGTIIASIPKLRDLLNPGATNGATQEGWHVLLGSGGSKSALTGAGVVLATRAARLKIDSWGGVSGGMIPASLAATEMPSHQLLAVAKETDIASLLTQRPLFKQVVKEHKRLDLLKDGIYDTAPLGDMVHGHMPEGEWPEKLWTMAVGDEHSEVVFTHKGVTEYTPGGQHVLSSEPVTVRDATRATVAIPGVLASMTLFGRRLYDGALGKFGKCPSDMATKHFGIPQERIIASLPVGAMTTANQKLYQFAKYLSGNLESGADKFVEHAGIVIRPEVKSFHSLRFSLQPAQREEAIMAGYRSALEEFARNNLIKGESLIQARAAGQSMSALEQFFAPKPTFPFLMPQLLRLTGPKTPTVTKV